MDPTGRWTALVLVVAAALGGCAADAPTAECSLGAPAVVKLSRQNYALTMAATIDGTPARFTLDTGADRSLVSRAAAPRFQLIDMDAYADIVGVGGRQRAQDRVAARFTLGDMTAKDVHFLVADMAGPAANAGLIGRDFLKYYDIDLDLAAGRVLLYLVKHDCTQPSARMAQPMFALKLVPDTEIGGSVANPEFVVPVEINGVRLLALIDTGAYRTSISRAAARRVGIADARLDTDRKVRIGGVGGRRPMVPLHVLPALQLGDLEVSALPVLVLSNELPGLDMILGTDLMSRVHFWISNASHTLILQYPPQKSPDS